MKGCALRLAFQLALLLALGFGFAWFVHTKCGTPLVTMIGPSLFFAIPAWIGLGLIFGIYAPLRERRHLARAMNGEPPVDGAIGVITGTIHAEREPLEAPLSGARCVAFTYDITKYVGSGKSSSLATLYQGVAVIPSIIRTKSGSYRLLAVPEIDAPTEALDRDAAQRRAERYVQTTKFLPPPKEFTRPEVEKRWSDDDGSYRHEVSRVEGETDLSACQYNETIIPEGASVCVFGRYSAERGGIVADKNWANKTRVMTADGATIMQSLRGRVMRYLIFGAIFCGVAAWILLAVAGSDCVK